MSYISNRVAEVNITSYDCSIEKKSILLEESKSEQTIYIFTILFSGPSGSVIPILSRCFGTLDSLHFHYLS